MRGPGDHVGPYLLRHVLGSGGIGQVFAAFDERQGEEVAVKLLNPEAMKDPQVVARFLQERTALTRIRHPGVVRVLDCDRLADGTVYLVMELLRGCSLREWIQHQPGPVPLRVALAISRRIAEVMVDVHTTGIVHRDLKPENVFLCSGDDAALGDRIKLLDFGIAKVPPSEGPRSDTQVRTNGTHFLGTYLYTAPEQGRDPANVKGSADVYALGVLLFELRRSPEEERRAPRQADARRQSIPDRPVPAASSGSSRARSASASYPLGA